MLLTGQCCCAFLHTLHNQVAANSTAPIAESVRYIAEPTAPAAVDFSTASGIIELHQLRARRLVHRCAAKFNDKMAESEGLGFDEVLNKVAMAACRASEAHSVCVTCPRRIETT